MGPPGSTTYYGRLQRNGKLISAHRYFYEKYVGTIPQSYEVHHLCHNTLCVNPDHLVALSTVDHGRLSRGHKLSAETAGEIKHLLETQTLSMRQIADMFSISYSHVASIRRGRFWDSV